MINVHEKDGEASKEFLKEVKDYFEEQHKSKTPVKGSPRHTRIREGIIPYVLCSHYALYGYCTYPFITKSTSYGAPSFDGYIKTPDHTSLILSIMETAW